MKHVKRALSNWVAAAAAIGAVGLGVSVLGGCAFEGSRTPGSGVILSSGDPRNAQPFGEPGFITVYRGINLPPGASFSGVYPGAGGAGQMVATSPEAAFQYGVLTGNGSLVMTPENEIMIMSFQINPADSSVVAQDISDGAGEHFLLQPSVDISALPNFQYVQTTLGDIAADGTVPQTMLTELTTLAEDPAGAATILTSQSAADGASELASNLIANPQCLELTVEPSGNFVLDGISSFLSDTTGASFELTGTVVGDAFATALGVGVGIVGFASDVDGDTLRTASGEQIVPVDGGGGALTALSGVPAIPASMQDNPQYAVDVLPNGDWSATNQTTGLATGFVTVGGKTYPYNEGPILDSNGDPTGLHQATLSNGDTLEVNDMGQIVQQGSAVFTIDVTANGSTSLAPPEIDPDPAVELPIAEVSLPGLSGGVPFGTSCENSEHAAPTPGG